MAYREQDLGALVRLNPEEARRIILAAAGKCVGRRYLVAKQLGVGRASVDRWCIRLGIEDAFADAVAESGRARTGEAKK